MSSEERKYINDTPKNLLEKQVVVQQNIIKYNTQKIEQLQRDNEYAQSFINRINNRINS